MEIIESLRRAALGIAAGALFAAAPAARADTDLWPLFETSEQGTTVLYPLYVHEGQFLMLFPAYARTNEGRDHHLFWPLVKVADGRVDRVAPFWFSARQGEYTMLPLFQRTRDYTLTLIPPSYVTADGKQTTFVPFYSRSWSESQGQVEERRTILWPLYTRSRRTDADGVVLEQSRSFALFRETRGGGTRRLTFLGLPIAERVE
jgi:hypothetical protein